MSGFRLPAAPSTPPFGPRTWGRKMRGFGGEKWAIFGAFLDLCGFVVRLVSCADALLRSTGHTGNVIRMYQTRREDFYQQWAAAHEKSGHVEFTVSDIKKEVDEIFRAYKRLSQRTVYDIVRLYTEVLGVTAARRTRRNFTEQVFTPEQVGEILYGIDRKFNSTLSYAEAFLEMRQRKFGEEPSALASASPSGSVDLSEVLAELRSLRAEVAQLRSAGSGGESSSELEGVRAEVASLRSEVEQLRRGALTRANLWRAVVAMVGLSVPGGDVSPERFMAYLGVDESELEAMSHFGLDGAGE